MRIIHVVRQFHPAVGGLETVVLELAREQVRAGHSVRVITLNRLFKATNETLLPADEIVNGIEVVRIPFIGSSRYPIAPAVLWHLGKADIVHVHGIDFFFDFLAWTKPIHHRTLVVSSHGGFFHTESLRSLKRFYFTTVTRLSLHFYAAIIAVSQSDQALFCRIRKRGMVCIENGVDLNKYANAASEVPRKAIITHGRLASNKRLDKLISLLAELRRIDKHWTLKVAGRPWDISVADLEVVCDEAGVKDAVHIVAAPSDETIRQLMKSCSLFASASEYEGFGISAVEAMSAGLFPILSPIRPYIALLSSRGVGRIVEFDDPPSAVDEVISAWKDFANDYDEIKSRIKKAAARYDWRSVSDEYEGVYRDVLGKRHRTILGVPITVKLFEDAVSLLDAAYKGRDPIVVAFANAHSLNIAADNLRFREILNSSVIFNDGVGVDIASRILFKSPFPHNLNGTDLVPRYLATTSCRLRIFLLGGKEEVVKRAAAVFAEQFPQHQIVGYHHGYFAAHANDSIVATIRSSEADVVLVAMGNPKQEVWLADNLVVTGCKLGFGVGALFDFMAAEAKRAPRWIRTCRGEWLYRLFHEPQRLWVRYLVGNPKFIMRVFLQWFSGARI
jgi:alpha-1,3-mannosyltransferase